MGECTIGSIYKGSNLNTNEIVSVKVINSKWVNADVFLRESLTNEIKILSRMSSKFIVRLLDVLRTNNNYYII